MKITKMIKNYTGKILRHINEQYWEYNLYKEAHSQRCELSFTAVVEYLDDSATVNLS